MRAPKKDYLEKVLERVNDCARGAALMTGCRVEIERDVNTFYDMRNDPPLNARAAEHLMKNYLDFGKCGGGRWIQYLYLDTEDFLLGSLLTREQVKVKFETCLMRDNEKYRMVMMKVERDGVPYVHGPGETGQEIFDYMQRITEEAGLNGHLAWDGDEVAVLNG